MLHVPVIIHLEAFLRLHEALSEHDSAQFEAVSSAAMTGSFQEAFKAPLGARDHNNLSAGT